MSDLKTLTKSVVSFRNKRNWKQFHNPKDLAISLSLEASELLEQLDRFVRKGYYAQVDWNYHSDVFVVFLESYNDDIEKVVQQAFHADMMTAIERALAAPQVLLNK